MFFWVPALRSIRKCWLGCWAFFVFFASPACTPPILAGVCGTCVRLWVFDLPGQIWLGVRLCVFVCAPRLYPGNPGRGLLFVCLIACFAELGALQDVPAPCGQRDTSGLVPAGNPTATPGLAVGQSPQQATSHLFKGHLIRGATMGALTQALK